MRSKNEKRVIEDKLNLLLGYMPPLHEKDIETNRL